MPVTRHKRGKEVNDLFVEFIAWCKDKKVTFIVAAGNKDVPKLHQATPQRLGTSDNGLITVGGVNEDGTLYHLTTVQKPGKAGSMTVFAPAQDVRVPGPGPEFHAGTSQAAAIVVSKSTPVSESVLIKFLVWYGGILLRTCSSQQPSYRGHETVHEATCLDAREG